MKTTEINLERFFNKLVNNKLSFFSDLDTLPYWLALEKRYNEPLGLKKDSTDEIVRTYHNLEHIKNGLVTLIGVSKEYSSQVVKDVAIAWFYHDCVYNVTKSDNEVCSGLVALKDLIEMGWTGEQAGRIYDLIYWTKHNINPPTEDFAANLIIDVDLAGIASDRDTFVKTSHNVRLEFFHVSDEQWIEGRKSFWKNFLSNKGSKIFQSNCFKHLNEKAKENILFEIDSLEKGIVL